MIGAKSGVVSNVPAGEKWLDFPAWPGRDFLRATAALRKRVEKEKRTDKCCGRFRPDVTLVSALLGATLFVLIAMAPAAAQQGDLNAILKRFSELYAAGNYPAALVEAQKLEARVKARFGVNHANYGIALNNLAVVYETQGKYAEAERLFKRALAIREKALGARPPRCGQTLNNLAIVYHEQGKYADAEALYKRALAIREKALGADHPDVAASLNNLAVVYRQQGRYAEAERSTSARWRSARRRSAPTTPMWPRASTTWPSCTRAKASTPRPSRSTSARWRSRRRRSAPDHPDVATTLNNLADPVRRAKASTPTPSRSSSARWRSGRRRSAQTTPTWPRASTTWPSCTRPRPVRRGRGAPQARAGDRGEGARRGPSCRG